MATSSNHLAGPYCSSSFSSSTTCWDVFLSFYGMDTRKNFTSHLYSALVRAGILTFMDDPELHKGEEISHGLLNAIRASKIFVVVLSENYAFSRWCLDELVEILACKRIGGHVVIPVFYYVDPSDLRYQKGSFGEALHYHKKRYTVDLMDNWKSALAEIAELSGYHLKMDANENESDTVQEIVEYLTPLISTKDLHVEKYLVGIDSSVEEIYRKLCMEPNDVRAIGICGMGGIGKTTTAKAFYNKYFNIFDISCFVDDLKQHSQGGRLQNLLVKLFGRSDDKVHDVKVGVRRLEQFLRNKKALIVLDDLDQSSYSELLVRLCKLLFSGSRIIFTTRDANLVNQLKEDISEVDIYMMRKLKQVDSMELFSYHAFRKSTPPESFKKLTESFITYAGGLPLALMVLGSSLLGRTDVSFWKDKLVKIQKYGENDIQKILQLSYDELGDKTQQAIFLDIAFFFIGRDRDEADHIFQSCDFFPDVGIPVLVERCLLTVDRNNRFQMHKLIRDMANEVIREESKNGNCRHLLLCEGDACMALENLEGIQKVEGLIIDQTKSTKRHFSAKILKRMPNLRLLKIIAAHDVEGDFKNVLLQLRCIRWSHCPWKRLPSSFHPPKLVSLHMPYSNLRTFWKNVKPLVNLKTINVSHSSNLKIMPDFTNLQSVEKLVFRGCESLLQVHPSIGRLTNLSHLDLNECNQLKKLTEPIGQLTKLGNLDLGQCVNLKRLPEAIIQLTTVGSLNLGNCHNLTRLPEQLGDMKCLKYLDAGNTSIEQLPDSIGYLKELVGLKLHGCNMLRKLPAEIGNMESLKLFDASFSAIEHLPDTFGGLINLDKLELRFCRNLTSLPNTLWKLKVLRVLNLEKSSKLEQLPEQLGKMQCLERLSVSQTAVEELPDSIGLLSKLRVLDLEWCKVRNLPSSIWNLTSLAELSLQQVDMVKIDLPDIVKDMKLKSLRMTCDGSLCLPVILSLSSLERLFLRCQSQSISPNEPYSLSYLSNLRELTLHNYISYEYCSFPELPLNLTELGISNYGTLEMLPDLSSLKQLKILRLQSCSSLQSIPPLPPHIVELELDECTSLQSIPPLPPHLERLYLHKCTSLQDLPDLSFLKELRRLSLKMAKCINLKSNSLKQSILQVGQHKLKSFKADLPNKEVGEWFSYKSSGNTLSFTIPPDSGDNFFGLWLWIVYKFKKESSFSHLRAIIDNRTKKIASMILISLPYDPLVVGEVQSRVECITRKYLIMESGDRIEVSLSRSVYFDLDYEARMGEVKVKKCGVHVIWRKPC